MYILLVVHFFEEHETALMSKKKKEMNKASNSANTARQNQYDLDTSLNPKWEVAQMNQYFDVSWH